ncbi:putative protein kinase RLK-Pelle-LRR-IX family [Helianthus annuus]|nr:putative protein kinase RLK-Pelle-LRR-IX family [Helianthus annuus]
MVDYHRHTCTLILTIILIYTFLISIIFSTTDPNVLNQLRKGLDLSNNNFSPPQPKYNPSMKLVLTGNPLFQSNSSIIPRQPSSPSGPQPDNNNQLSPGITPSTSDSGIGGVPAIQLKKKPNLGHGGFGVVYKVQLDDGTKIADKRMESGVICNKALDEFKIEISVLTKVRHKHLVLLLGYSTQGLKIILVYEYMRQGELSRHLFHWKNLKLEPLSWKRRLSIALDVARGMEYLHSLAQ